MFNNYISSIISPLTSTYVGKLTRIYNDPDYSLICLMTALVKPRVKNYVGVTGSYKLYRSPEAINNDLEMLNALRSEIANKDAVENLPAFYYFIADMNEDQVRNVRAKASEIGLTELIAVENFIKQQLNMADYSVFINPESNTAFVVAGSTSMSLYHLSISFISLLYPVLFKENPLSKEEVEAVKGLTNKTSANFIERISSLLQYMKADLLRVELAECFKGFRQRKIDQSKLEMDTANTRVEQALDQYRRYVEQYNECVLRYEGMLVVNSDDRNNEEQETIEYIASCPNLTGINYSNGVLEFCTTTFLTNFDIEKWRNAVRRNNIYESYRLPEENVFKDKTKRKLLFDNIFSAKPLLYVKMKGNIELQINRFNMSAPMGQNLAENNSQLKDYITNPHFKIHGCPGRNKEQIIRCLKQGDVESAIECSVAATGSVNIDETEYTFRPFLQEILISKNKILQNTQGESMTPEEALLWLYKQNLTEE